MTLETISNLLEGGGQIVFARGAQDIAILCPFCPEGDPDTKGKCYVSPYKYNGIYHCFRCEVGGSIRYLFEHLGIPYGSAKMSLDRMREAVIRRQVDSKFVKAGLPSKLQPVHLPEGVLSIQDKSTNYIQKRAYDWLLNRGLNLADIQYWKIGYCPYGKFAEHLIVPVEDGAGNIVTFQARRYIGSQNPKTKNPWTEKHQVGKMDVLYGMKRSFQNGNVILVEGPWDVIHLTKVFQRHHLEGWYALALLGHQLSKIQLGLLEMLQPESVYVMLDADAVADGRKMARKVKRFLESKVYCLELEHGDPDDLPVDELLQKIISAKESLPEAGRIIKTR